MPSLVLLKDIRSFPLIFWNGKYGNLGKKQTKNRSRKYLLIYIVETQPQDDSWSHLAWIKTFKGRKVSPNQQHHPIGQSPSGKQFISSSGKLDEGSSQTIRVARQIPRTHFSKVNQMPTCNDRPTQLIEAEQLAPDNVFST